MGIDDDHLTYLDAGRIAADLGVAWVALHARTAEQLYAPSARWAAIGELVSHVDIPVLGNGDIFDAADATAMQAETGCAGVVIGRGCLGKPHLFSDLRATFDGAPPPPPPRLGEVAEMVLEHARLLVSWRDESRLHSFRKHIGWYLKGYPIGAHVRRNIGNVETFADIEELLADLNPEAELPEENRRLVKSHSGGPRRVVLPEGWLADPEEDIDRLSEADSAYSHTAISGG
jgi:tRNA-dihydrouridine synthase